MLTWVGFIALGCLLLAGAGVERFTLLRLKRRHNATWQDLGEPTPIWHYSTTSQFRFMHFAWSGRYRMLGDPVLNRAVLFEKIIAAVFIVLFLGLIYSTLAAPPPPSTQVARPAAAVPIIKETVRLPSPKGWVLLFALVLHFISFQMILSRLKRRHGATWRRLGEAEFMNATPRNAVSLAWFFLSFQCRHLGDRRLNVLCGLNLVILAFVALSLAL